jgi:hypothetical protein
MRRPQPAREGQRFWKPAGHAGVALWYADVIAGFGVDVLLIL